MTKKQNRKRGLSLFLALLMVFSVTAQAYALSGTINSAEQLFLGSGSSTWSFTVRDRDGVIADGACMDPGNDNIPMKGAAVSMEKLSNSSTLAKVAYLGSKAFTSDKQQYIVGRAAAYVAGNVPYNNYLYHEEVNDLVDRAKASGAAPSNFEAFKVSPNNGGQMILAWREAPEGYLKIKKVVARDEALVDKCPENYSLAGAKYAVYANSSLTDRVGTLTTKSDGSTNSLTLEAGTYWVKEVTASKGFKLDPTTHKVTVKSGSTATVTSKEEPMFDPMNILLKKQDDGGNGDSPSLAGAQFTVKYYTEVTENVSGLTPERTWIFETNSKGLTAIDESFKVGGDKLFTDSEGYAVGLIGTYEIYESKAPDGYVLNDKHFIRSLYQQGQTLVYNEPIVPEERKEVRFVVVKQDEDLKKAAAQGDATLSGAVFGLYEKDGTLIDEYTTDEKGGFTTKYYAAEYAFEEALYFQEITPPDGYLLSEKKFPVNAKDPAEIKVQYTTSDRTVTDEVIKGRIGLMKSYDDEDETEIQRPEKGIDFQVYLKSAGSFEAAADYNKALMTTDKDGYAETKDLPFGTYIVHQVNSTPGHGKVEDFEVTIREDGAVHRYILNNATHRADIHVEKVDAETGKAIVLSSAEFKIWHVDKKEWVTFAMHYPHEYILDTFVTDENGGFSLPAPLKHGNYELVEVKAPEGYVLNEKRIPFKVDGSSEAVSLRMENKPQKGTIDITKTGEMLTTWQKHDDGTYTPVYKIGNIPGAEYTIKAAEDIITADNTVRVRKGEVVATVTTGENGFIKSPQLYLGKYTVQETKAPEGFVLNPETFNIELDYAGQRVELVSEALTVKNDRQKAEVSLVKQFETDETFAYLADGYKKIRFGLYAKNEMTAADGSKVPAGGLIEEIGVTPNGAAYAGIFKTDLPQGSFYVQEKATPTGYIIDDTKYPVDFTYAGQDTAKVDIEVNKGEALNNELIRGDIRGHKVTDEGTDLSGALIGLFKAGETDFTVANAILTDTSGKQGEFAFENVPYGEYLVREILAPTGCVLNETIYPAVIDKDGAVIELSMENKLVKGVIKVSKTGEIFADVTENEDGTYTPVFAEAGLSGAKYKVTAAEDIVTPDGVKRYSKGDIVTTFTTEGGGKGESLPQHLGKYDVQEITAPEGFILNPTVYHVELKYAGQKVELVSDEIAQFDARQKVSVSLTKQLETDDLFGYETSGYEHIRFGLFAENELTAANGKKIPAGAMIEQIGVADGHNGADGYTGAFGADLPFGSFYVQEVATKDGYILDDTKYPVEFTYAGQYIERVNIVANNGTPLENELIRGNIEGHKVSEDGSDLPNALIGLFEKDETEFTEDTALMVDVTDSKGAFSFRQVPHGEYLVREIQPPAGFVLLKEAVPVSITEDEQVIEVELVNEFTKVEILKVNAETGKPLAGAHLQLLDAKGNIVADWITEEEAKRFDRLPIGEYTLHEVSAPKGYLPFTDQKIVIEETAEVQQFVLKDDVKVGKLTIEKPGDGSYKEGNVSTYPQTGDETMLSVYLYALIMSLIGVSVLMATKRKRVTNPHDPHTEHEDNI